MRISKFYKKPSDELSKISDLRITDKYPLYAIALDKKDAKVFRETRDMEKFIEITDHIEPELEEETLESINKVPLFRGAVLDIRDISEIDGKYERNESTKSIPILMTENEYLAVKERYEESVLILSPMWWDGWCVEATATKFLKDKYRNALDTLDFRVIMKYTLEDKFYGIESDIEYLEDFTFPNWRIDEFSLYVHLFGWSYK